MSDEVLCPACVTARRSGGRVAAERVESTGVLRGSGDSAQGVRQLAGEVQSRAPTAGAQAALPARWA